MHVNDLVAHVKSLVDYENTEIAQHVSVFKIYFIQKRSNTFENARTVC